MQFNLLFMIYVIFTLSKVIAAPHIIGVKIQGLVTGLPDKETVTVTDTLTPNNTYTLSNGTFSTTNYYNFGASYNYKVISTPSGMNCQIINGSGGPLYQNVNNITINCSILANSFFAVADKGQILFSGDGTNWTSTNINTTSSLFDVLLFSNNFYLVGDNGTFYSSQNINSTWNKINVSSTFPIYSISTVTLGVIPSLIIIGGNGLIQTSTDFLSWNTQSYSLGLNLVDFSYCNSNAYAIGNYTKNVTGGVVFMSELGTINNWSPVISFINSPSATLNTIVCYSSSQIPSKILVAGNNGVLTSSLDDGVTWNTIIINNLFNSSQLINGSNDTLVVVGKTSDNNGAVFSSTDGGTTWVQQIPNQITLQPLSSIAISASGTYVATGTTNIYKSTDLINWEITYTGTQSLFKVRSLK